MNYLLVCCLKSGHEYKNDWRFPGACYGSVLPGDLSVFNADHTLTLEPVMTDMLRNHGYSQIRVDGYDAAVVGCEDGTFLFKPPVATGCANLMHFVNQAGQDVLVGTNREIDEVAMYTITE